MREYRFGDFILRPAARQLLLRGAAQRLGKRAFDLLLVLVENAGEVVPRDQLFARVWAGRVVSDDNLKVQVMALRAVVGADAIVTAAGVGYRFALPVSTDAARPAAIADIDAGMSLLGRVEELQQLGALIESGRLVTLVGSGGVGKTRLALALAAAVAGRHEDGAAVIELAGVQDAQLVCGAVARQLRLPHEGAVDAERLARALAPLSLLLVLDNCEHLLAAVSEMASAVRARALRLAIVATSQEPLGLEGEIVFRVGGLPLPSAQDRLEALQGNPAASLLIERVRQLDPGVTVSAEHAPAIAAICRGLDGLPLAIELAAARVPLLGWDGTRDRLDRQLALLTRGRRDAPTRHQTLRAALQWSHSLLSPQEKRLFRQLGIFADTFSIATAEALAGAALDLALDVLQSLVDKSLVQRLPGPAGQPRLRLLVSAREFALERLAEAGELEPLRRRHADVVAECYERAYSAVEQRPLLPWLERMGPELPDLRSALSWAAGPTGDGDRLLRLVGAAGYYMNASGLHDELRRWLAVARPLATGSAPPRLRARYWAAAAYRAVDPTAPIGDALQAAEQALALFEALGDDEQAYRMLGLMAHHGRRLEPPLDVELILARMRALEQPHWSSGLRTPRVHSEGIALARAGRWQAYRDHFAAEAARAEAEGDELRRWGCQHHICLGDLALGEPRRAAEGMRPVVERLRTLGFLRWQWTRPALYLMALIECGDVEPATAALRETLPLLRVAGAVDWMPHHLGLWALLANRPDDAARLLGWAERAGGTVQRGFHGRQAAARLQAQLRQQLGETRQQALADEGREWSTEIVEYRLVELLSQAGAARLA